MLRGAFIGFGNVAAQGHLPGWLSVEGVEIVAATDAIVERRESFLASCPRGRWHENLDDLLSDRTLDFVDICTPPSSHAALVKRALDADFHVLCEKPLVTRLADAQAIAAAAAGVRTLHTVHNWLKAPVCEKISELIDQDAVGRVRSVRWQTLRTEPAVAVTPDGRNWRLDPAVAGGGILLDHGWHALYCVLRWAGVPRSIAAVLENRRHHEWPLEDTATLSLDLDSGNAEIHLTWCASERSNRIEIEGERGDIIVVDDTLTLRADGEEIRWILPPSLARGSHHREWFVGVAGEFRDAVIAGGRGNLEEALLCARMIDLAQRSSAGGGLRLALETTECHAA
ncbi:MAG TPA: Gfo/Idh/MocA family oxidoreductase [Pseudolabrys sp.]|nr:Gfo/Idh/MocA family oxidoreductase [Pseudolabrys sp.]